MASTESGSYQLHTWDRATGERRQVTEDPVGVLEGRPTRDGTGVIWFHDETGAESGSYVIAAFDERTGAEPLIEGLPVGWPEGLAIGRTRSIAGVHRRGVLGLDGGARRRRPADPRAPRARAARGRLGADERGRPAGAVERRDARGPRGHGGRRRAPPDPAVDRRGHRRDRRRAARRGPGAVRVRVLAAARRHADGDHPRADRRAASGDLGRSHGRGDRPAARAARADRARGLVGRRLGPAPAPARRRPAPPPPLRPRDGRGHPARHRAGIDHGGGRPARWRGLVPRPQRPPPGDAARGRVDDAAARPRGIHGARGAAVRALVVREPQRPAGPRVPRAAGGRRAPPGDDAGARRAALDRHGPLGPRRPRPRRCRVPRRDGQLPRVRRVRAGVARRADGERGVPGGRGRAGRPRRPRRARAGRPGPGRAGRLVMGRLRHADGARAPSGSLGRRDRGRAGGRLHRGVRGRGADPPGPRPCAVRRVTGDEARAVPRAEPDHLCGRRAGPAADHGRRERLPLPDPPGLELRRQAAGRGLDPEVYTYATGHSSFDVEERVRQTAIVLDFLARSVPGVERLGGLDAHLAAAGVVAA